MYDIHINLALVYGERPKFVSNLASCFLPIVFRQEATGDSSLDACRNEGCYTCLHDTMVRLFCSPLTLFRLSFRAMVSIVPPSTH